jgi:hypothetical protein
MVLDICESRKNEVNNYGTDGVIDIRKLLLIVTTLEKILIHS